MQGLAQEVWRREPTFLDSDTTVGELAWTWGVQHRSHSSEWTQRIWSEGGTALAWGWIYRGNLVHAGAHPATLVWQVHPDRPGLLSAVLDWFEAENPGGGRQTSVRSANAGALALLRERGYVHDDDAPFGLLNLVDLDGEIEEPEVPAGYELRTMREVEDVSLRVAVHRAAWQPSRVTEAAYADVTETWPYRVDLDFVVQAPDGSLVASALGWYDADNRVGEFEPIGTHPDHRRLGLGRAVILFGLERIREAGAERAIVGCRGDADYPIPKQLYHSIGFREISRQLPLKYSLRS